MPVLNLAETAAEFRRRWLAAMPQTKGLGEDAHSVAIALLLAGPNNPAAEFYADLAVIARRLGISRQEVERAAAALASARLVHLGAPVDGCSRVRLTLPTPRFGEGDYV